MSAGVVAIVAAAGSGTRFAPKGGKTFFRFRGRPVLLHTLCCLDAVPEITEIIPAVKPEDRERVLEMAERAGIGKVRRVAPGGHERQDSVYNALNLVTPQARAVLVHDGARPFAAAGFISGLISALDGYDGVVPGLMPRDTIKEISEDGCLVVNTVRRERLVAVQTPQVFRYEVLFNAYAKAMASGLYSTDDSALVEAAGGRVRVVPGLESNIKITTVHDIQAAEGFLER